MILKYHTLFIVVFFSFLLLSLFYKNKFQLNKMFFNKKTHIT